VYSACHMTRDRDQSPGFGWNEPRWRETDEDSKESQQAHRGEERSRRFRNTPAPGHRGAIDGRAVGDEPAPADTPSADDNN
jgi:hypothetical protein